MSRLGLAEKWMKTFETDGTVVPLLQDNTTCVNAEGSKALTTDEMINSKFITVCFFHLRTDRDP